MLIYPTVVLVKTQHANTMLAPDLDQQQFNKSVVLYKWAL